MKFSTSLLALALALPSLASAGTIKVVGQATVYHKAEYATVSAYVYSRCHESAQKAQQANADLAKQISEVFSKYVDKSDTTLGAPQATGGFPNWEPARYEYNDKREKVKTGCGGWEMSNTITLKTKNDPDALSRLLDEMSPLVDRAAGEVTAMDKVTYATLSQPTGCLKDETKRALRAAAIKEARLDAKAQLDALAGDCGMTDLHIEAVEPYVEEGGYRGGYRAMALADAAPPAPGGARTATPVELAEQGVTQAWRFTYSYSGGNEACTTPAAQANPRLVR